jgi:hypothetical protein
MMRARRHCIGQIWHRDGLSSDLIGSDNGVLVRDHELRCDRSSLGQVRWELSAQKSNVVSFGLILKQ